MGPLSVVARYEPMLVAIKATGLNRRKPTEKCPNYRLPVNALNFLSNRRIFFSIARRLQALREEVRT
jgi:hypothetical protein